MSNIVCKLDTQVSHPALVKQLTYADISFDQIAKMSQTDRQLVSGLMGSLGFTLNPASDQFAESCYDALWKLGTHFHKEAQALETSIFTSAYEFAQT